MNLRSSFLQKAGRIAAVALASFVPLVGGGATATLADGGTGSGATYNNIAGEFTIRVWDATRNTWVESVAASSNETRSVFLYAHQTNTNVSPETLVKAVLPTGYSTTSTISGLVTAVGGAQIEGRGTTTITTQQPVKITLVPSSVQYYATVNSQLVPSGLPGNQDVNNLVTSTGLNLGAHPGCWDNIKAIRFDVKIEAQGNPVAYTEKTVARVADQNYQGSTQVAPGELVGFRVLLRNDGNGTGKNTFISDELDGRMTYVANSSFFRVKVNNADQDIPVADNLIRFEPQTNGNTKITWAYYDMPAQQSAAIFLVFQAKVKGNDTFAAGTTTTLNNCALGGFTGSTHASNCVTIKVVRPIDDFVAFTIRKEVLNVTLGDNQWHDDQLPAAVNPGDTLAYGITITNSGNIAASNVTLKDMLPDGLTYAGNAKVYSFANPNGVTVDAANIVTAAGYTFPTLAAGNTGYQMLIFQVKTPTTCAANTTLVNTATVNWNGAERGRDTASALFTCRPGMIFKKEIRNASGSFVKDAGTVVAGQTLTYRITVSNSGNTTVKNIRVKDIAPAFVSFVPGTLSIDGQTVATITEQAFFSTGMLLTDFTPGMTKTILVSFKVADCPNLGDTQITNTAQLTADGVTTLTDTALATIHVEAPHF